MITITSAQAQTLRLALQTKETVTLPHLLSLLADPTRFRVVKALALYPKLCVTDLAHLLLLTAATISHHLRILKDAGVVSCERMGQTQCYELTRTDAAQLLKKLVSA
jgi:ArsR family transcriptional regulator